MKNIFENLFLDTSLTKTLEFIGLKEGMLTKSFAPYSFLPSIPKRNNNKGYLLLLLTMYENINLVPYHDLNYTILIDNGIKIERSSITNSLYTENTKHLESLIERFDYIFFFIKQEPKHFIEMFINDYRNASSFLFDELYDEYQFIMPWHNPQMWTSQKSIDFSYLKNNYDIILEATNKMIYHSIYAGFNNSENIYFDYGFEFSQKHPELVNIILFLIKFIKRSIIGLGISNSTLALDFPNQNENCKLYENFEKLIFLTKVKLDDVIEHLPNPQTFKEAFELKKTNEMRRFRELFTNWIEAIHKGDEFLEKEIRKEIKLSNSYLDGFSKWRKVYQHPFNFYVNSIGGHIPIFSNILTAIYTLDGLSEKHIKRYHNWTTLIKN